MLRTEVTVGGCCWSVEATIRRSLFYEGKRQILCFCAQRSHPQVLAARCSNCSTNYASDIPGSYGALHLSSSTPDLRLGLTSRRASGAGSANARVIRPDLKASK